MYREKFSERSPLRVLEKSIDGGTGGLGAGNIGAVVSRAGVGKTALLVQVGIDNLIRERKVMHVSVDQSVDHVRTWYDEMLDELARGLGLGQLGREDRSFIERHRHIHTYLHHSFSVDKLGESVAFLKDHMDFEPQTVILDGFDFAKATTDEIAKLHSLAQQMQAEMWVSALSHRDEPIRDERGIPNPVARFVDHIAVVMYLEPRAEGVIVRILKDHDNPDVAEMHLELDRRSFLIRV